MWYIFEIYIFNGYPVVAYIFKRVPSVHLKNTLSECFSQTYIHRFSIQGEYMTTIQFQGTASMREVMKSFFNI